MISWLHQKPADLDPHCLQKMVWCYDNTLIKLNMVE